MCVCCGDVFVFLTVVDVSVTTAFPSPVGILQTSEAIILGLEIYQNLFFRGPCYGGVYFWVSDGEAQLDRPSSGPGTTEVTPCPFRWL